MAIMRDGRYRFATPVAAVDDAGDLVSSVPAGPESDIVSCTVRH